MNKLIREIKCPVCGSPFVGKLFSEVIKCNKCGYSKDRMRRRKSL